MRLPDPGRVRRPAVAGLFYPAETAELAEVVDRHLEEGASARREAPADAVVKALIAPHAGYVYSGPIAGSAFAPVLGRRDEVRRVVVVGPAHRVALAGLAIPESGVLETPLGRIPVDLEASSRIAELPQVTVDELPHLEEHALEVELPFLQRLLGSFEVLPLVVGAARPDQVAEVLELVWGGTETLIVVSSDLSHYLPYEAAVRIDRATADAIVGLAGPLASEQACGAAPINGLLEAARARSLRPRLLDLRNSGDTAGDRGRVVGYGAFAFHAA